jgi:type IV pilus assembly protein PilA
VSYCEKTNLKELLMKFLVNKTKGFTLVELMVVIVIIGILAAVAIPKFLDASQKAKASEFPTQLTAIYTGQLAYQAERGAYVTSYSYLRDSAGVDVPSTSRWFTYGMTAADNTSFTAVADVNTPGFGNAVSSFVAGSAVAASGEYGQVDQTNAKVCSSNLQRYCPNWK